MEGIYYKNAINKVNFSVTTAARALLHFGPQYSYTGWGLTLPALTSLIPIPHPLRRRLALTIAGKSVSLYSFLPVLHRKVGVKISVEYTKVNALFLLDRKSVLASDALAS